eukprot:5032411-Pyramimonas_sp.AAC.1
MLPNNSQMSKTYFKHVPNMIVRVSTVTASTNFQVTEGRTRSAASAEAVAPGCGVMAARVSQRVPV